MISGYELHCWAVESIIDRAENEIELRRGVSGLYYGLFHRLSQVGAEELARFSARHGEMFLRSYDHGRMFKVCERYPKDQLAWFKGIALNGWLIILSRAFVALKDAREKADYDLLTPFEKPYAVTLVELAESGHWALDDLNGQPILKTFLAALLLDGDVRLRG